METGAQREPKIEELGRQFGHPPLDPPRGAKWTQNGAKMKLKWRKMEPKWTQHGAKME